MNTKDITRHPATPGYLECELDQAPTFDESASFETWSRAQLEAEYQRLSRDNQRMQAQLKTAAQQHYQTQCALAGGEIAGEIKHGPNGIRVALTATGRSLPHGTLLVTVPQEVAP